MTTPARLLTEPAEHGLRWLTTDRVSYSDGSEEYVTALLDHAEDRHSLSDELALAARTWPEQYHFERGRANLLRPLTLHPDAKVLEVGCGCGAITSYLAEKCGAVDAVEPVAARARAARARTRGIGDTEVFVGGVQDIPEQPAYDLGVVVGVLEYVAAGDSADEPYVEFLRGMHRRLRDGGALVLAIENRIGVRYLAGAPEDHTGLAWDGVNGYPDGGVARTFSRGHLLRLLAAAGFGDAQVLSAFPDYKITRTLLTDELFTGWPRLARALPRFPSVDRPVKVTRPVREDLLWNELVDSGAGHAHGNSFVVVAGKDGPVDLWPRHQLAAFFNTDRARAFCASGAVERVGASVRVRRTPMAPSAAHGVSVVDAEDPFLDLPVVTDEIIRAPELTGQLLAGWRAVLERSAPALGSSVWDLVPQNLLAGPVELTPIDLEWSVDGCSVADVLARGVLLTADRIAAGSSADGRSVGDVLAALVDTMGLTDFSLPSAIALEGRFQAIRQLGLTDTETLRQRSADGAEAWRVRLDQPIGAGH